MEKEILRLINSHNGELSWYQLDRVLSYQHTYVDGIHRLVDVIKDLEHKACCVRRARGHNRDTGLRMRGGNLLQSKRHLLDKPTMQWKWLDTRGTGDAGLC